MKFLIGIMLLVFSLHAYSDDRADLLVAWENIQKSHKQVESFDKVSQGKYKIKFSVLPFEGELVVLTYDTEDIEFNLGNDNPYTKTGYFNIELVGADEKKLTKYGRAYYKWLSSNTLYLNSKTEKWVASSEYTKYFSDIAKDQTQNNFLSFLSGYWDFILIFIIAYFIISTISGNKQLKKSLQIQNDAAAGMDEVKKIQDDAMELHKETNKILGEILKELKDK